MWTPTYASRFSWIAEGIQGKPGKVKPRVTEQSGTFNSVAGETGDVSFVQPFQSPPNIELKGSDLTLILDTTPTGFRWKNAAKDLKDSKNVTWKAKGMLAQ